MNKQTDNARNRFGHKTLQTSYGEVDIKVPRDRQGEFDPKLIGKHKTMLKDEVERKIISMYAKGMTTGDLESIYAVVYMDAIHYQ